MGLAHGKALKPEIAELVKRWSEYLARTYKLPAGDFIRKFLAATDFKPAIDRWTPDLMDEVRGIADGAGLDFDTMFAFRLIDKAWVMGREASLDKCTCTAAGIGQSGRPVVRSWITKPELPPCLKCLSRNQAPFEAHVRGGEASAAALDITRGPKYRYRYGQDENARRFRTRLRSRTEKEFLIHHLVFRINAAH